MDQPADLTPASLSALAEENKIPLSTKKELQTEDEGTQREGRSKKKSTPKKSKSPSSSLPEEKTTKKTTKKTSKKALEELGTSIDNVIFFVADRSTCRHSRPKPEGHYTIEDVQEINLGGAIVDTIQYYVPDLNLGHPIFSIVLRSISLVLLIKEKCLDLVDKAKTDKSRQVKNIDPMALGDQTGVRPEYFLQ